MAQQGFGLNPETGELDPPQTFDDGDGDGEVVLQDGGDDGAAPMTGPPTGFGATRGAGAKALAQKIASLNASIKAIKGSSDQAKAQRLRLNKERLAAMTEFRRAAQGMRVPVAESDIIRNRNASGKVGRYDRSVNVWAGTEEGIAKYGATAGTATQEQLLARARDGYSGHGAYYGRWLASKLGRLAPVATPLFDKAENYLIDQAQGALSRYRGRGAYEHESMKRGRAEAGMHPHGFFDANQNHIPDDVEGLPVDPRGMRTQTNQLINPGSRFGQGKKFSPKYMHAGDETDDLIFEFSEYLGDIRPTTADFQEQRRIQLNPGLTESFGVLSHIAQLYSEYEFEQLFFEFKSTVTSGQDNAAGTVSIGTRYNPVEAPFATRAEIENSSYASSCRVSDNLVHGVECHPDKNTHGGLLYVRTDNIPDAQIQSYDKGYVQVVSQGCTPNVTIGSLYATYRVRFSKLANTDEQRPLRVGEGAALSMQAEYSVGSEQVSSSWTGHYTNEPILDANYPLAGWTVVNPNATSHDDGTPAYIQQQLIDAGSTANQQTGAVAGGANKNVWHIGNFSKSRELEMDIQRPGLNSILVTRFRAVPGATYAFVFLMRYQQGPSDDTVDPSLIPKMPAPVAPATAGGRFEVRVLQGPLRHANGAQNRLIDAVRVGGGEAELVGMYRASCTLRVVGSVGGFCRVDIESFANTFATTRGVTAFSWRFARIE